MLTNLDLVDLQHLGGVRSLFRSLSGAEAQKSSSSSAAKSLRFLNLSCNRLGPEGASALATLLLPNCLGLQDLILKKCSLGPFGASALAAGLPPNIRCLHLSTNWLGDEGVEALSDAIRRRCPQTLQRLKLGRSNLGPRGACAVAEVLLCCSKLEVVSLKHNRLGPEGVTKLAEAIQKVEAPLRLLDLQNTRPGPLGAEVLALALANRRIGARVQPHLETRTAWLLWNPGRSLDK